MGDAGLPRDNHESYYNTALTRAIVCDYIKYHLNKKGYDWQPSGRVANGEAENGRIANGDIRRQQQAVDAETAMNEIALARVRRTMRTLGDEFHASYADKFNDMCEQLHVTLESARPTLVGVADELFREGGIHWSKIIALLAFGAAFSARCFHAEMPQVIDAVVSWIVDYMDRNLAPWIQQHGSWDGFVDYFDTDTPQERQEIIWPTIKNFFCGVAAGAIGVLTIGAVLTSR